FRDGIFAHAGEKIVRIIIFTDMLEAELPVFAGAQPAFRRAMGRRRFASGPLAAWELIAQAVRFGLNPDPVEQWGICSHCHDYASVGHVHSRLDSTQIKPERSYS